MAVCSGRERLQRQQEKERKERKEEEEGGLRLVTRCPGTRLLHFCFLLSSVQFKTLK